MTKYLLLFSVLIVTSCYTEQKARQQFSKAAIAYPKLPADYCANEFPIRDSITTDTVLTTDTLFIEGQDLTDTVTVNDTVRITIIKTLPGRVITNTVHIRDTIIRENTAALAACKIDNSNMTSLLVKQTAQTDKYKGQAGKRGWIMWSLILLIIVYSGWKVYGMFKPKIKV